MINNSIQQVFVKNNLQDNRQLIADFCQSSPMFDVVATKVKQRYLELENGHWLADFATQDYLGLDFDQRVIKAAIEGTKKYGTVVPWCRLVATVDPFEQAERAIAKLVGSEACSIFASTTLLNHGVIPALLGKDGVLFLDKSAHATMYEGGKIARDSGSELVSFYKEDLVTLEKLLQKHKGVEKKLIAVDGADSMTGDYTDLPSLDKLAKKYNALIYVDDAHGFGVVGENPSPAHPYGHKGNGIVRYFDLDYENILYIGCFSKAYGTYGSFIACSRYMRDFLLSQATPHDLGGHGPASAMSALIKGLEINKLDGDDRRSKMFELTQKAKQGLKKLGFKLQGSADFPIISVLLGSSEHMLEVSKILFKNHILVTLAPYPMVSKGNESLRVTVTCTNTKKQIDQLINAFQKVKKYLIKNNAFTN